MSSITRITITSEHATHWSHGSAAQLHSTRHNTCTLLRMCKTAHASRQVQDHKDQVHFLDQRFVHNIIMMITSIKKLNITRNSSPDNAPNPIIILSNCEAKIFWESETSC